MKANMITPSNLSSIVIDGGAEPEHQVDATVNEQERGEDHPLTREMIQAMLHEQQEALIRQHKEAFDAMRQQQELAMASIRQENASIREMLHLLIQQPQQQQQKEFCHPVDMLLAARQEEDVDDDKGSSSSSVDRLK